MDPIFLLKAKSICSSFPPFKNNDYILAKRKKPCFAQLTCFHCNLRLAHRNFSGLKKKKKKKSVAAIWEFWWLELCFYYS